MDLGRRKAIKYTSHSIVNSSQASSRDTWLSVWFKAISYWRHESMCSGDSPKSHWHHKLWTRTTQKETQEEEDWRALHVRRWRGMELFFWSPGTFWFLWKYGIGHTKAYCSIGQSLHWEPEQAPRWCCREACSYGCYRPKRTKIHGTKDICREQGADRKCSGFLSWGEWSKTGSDRRAQ